MKMRDRGQIKINGVYLYTHWNATKLIGDVQNALAKRWRWNDHEYLARIIFDEMKRRGKILHKKYDFTAECDIGETGYGIGIEQHGDIWRLIEITADNKVIVSDYNEEVFKGSFEDFLNFKNIEVNVNANR